MARLPLIELLLRRFPGRPRRELEALVLRGAVSVDGAPARKPGVPVREDAAVEVPEPPAFVSRGGEKLAAAVEAWNVDRAAGPWIDAGCSTGGFTDCLLKGGAPLVYAVDVGVGQLAWPLRGDPRVRVMEGTNVMDLVPGSLAPAPRAAVVDLSFRSLRGAARHVLSLTADGWGIFLVKPQFEWADAPEEFRGVVRGAAAMRAIVEALLADIAREGVALERAMRSPVAGRKGNRELLCLLRSQPAGRPPGDLPGELFLE